LDPNPTVTVRAYPLREMDLIQAVGIRSDDPESRIPLRPGVLAKEPLSFREINPQYSLVQKYLRFSPVLLA
jgi:hypothetical protein